MSVRQRKAPAGSEMSPKSPASPDDKDDKDVHHVLQSRLRSVSQEDEELYNALGLSPRAPTLKAGKVPSQAPTPEEEADTVMGKAMTYAQRAHDDLEDWGYRNFPVITDHFNFLVYGVDLAVRSVRWFQFGLVACWLGLRLIVYAIMLLPVFVRIMLVYYHDGRIHRRIRYGPAEREYLDIYVPKEALAAQRGEGPKVPVVVAIMGGAFIIGHRGYNAQLGLRLMDFGVITVGVDYRNFPRGIIPDMVEDIGRGVRWVFQNIDVYGGDTGNMMLMGQSAGAHLAATLLLEHCLLETMGMKKETWSVSSFKAWVGISGPYDLIKLSPHLASRGLYPAIMDHMSKGDLAGSSPERLLDTEDWQAHKEAAIKLLPPIHLFHGYNDKAVPVWASSDFAEKLRESGVEKLTLDLRKGMTHTYPVIEGPMRRHDPQVEIILPFLFGKGAEKRLEASSNLPPLWPLRILDIAGHVSPF